VQNRAALAGRRVFALVQAEMRGQEQIAVEVEHVPLRLGRLDAERDRRRRATYLRLAGRHAEPRDLSIRAAFCGQRQRGHGEHRQAYAGGLPNFVNDGIHRRALSVQKVT
jgi:hypothetical protein